MHDEERRKQLVNKLFDSGLTNEEYAELDALQKSSGCERRRCLRVDQTPPKSYNAAIEPKESG